VEVSATHRLFLLAQARDRWRCVGLADPSGKSGSYVGQQTEYRLRYRWSSYFEFDTGLVLFQEGSFIRSVRRQHDANLAKYFFMATDWHF